MAAQVALVLLNNFGKASWTCTVGFPNKQAARQLLLGFETIQCHLKDTFKNIPTESILQIAK